MANNHEERIRQIETETAEIKRQMLEFEFQQKKEQAERKKELDSLRKESEIRNRQIERHLQHLSALAGIAFDELEKINQRLDSASAALSRKNKRSK